MLTLVLLGFGLSVMIATIATHAPAFTYNTSYMALSTQADMQTTRINSQAQSTATSTPLPRTLPLGKGLDASQNLKRINQLDCGQYASQAECATWAYSACSTAAITEVIDAYGYHYRITDILQQEVAAKAITPQLGLVDDQGIQRTVARFGFTTTWGYTLSLDQVIALANSGTPVIVGWPPAKYDGGHLVVVLGGEGSTVRLADSSRYNRYVLSHAQFLKWWAGFSAIVTPGKYSFIGKPTLSAAFIDRVLASYHSPAAGKEQALYELGAKYGIDPAYALAFFMHESLFGTTGEARKTMSLGNERCIADRACVDRNLGGYAQMYSWEDGFDHFYRLILYGYVGGEVTDPIAGHPCTTIEQAIPIYAPSSDNNNVAAYTLAIEHELQTWWAGRVQP